MSTLEGTPASNEVIPTLEAEQTLTPQDPQLERQRELEDNALALGAERFRRRLQQAEQSGKASTAGAARKLLSQALDPMTKAVEDMVGKKGKGKRHIAVHWCKALGADVAAYMTIRVVLDGIAKRGPIRSAAMDIADLFLDELRYRRFKEEAPQLFEYRMSKFNTSSYAHMARSLDATLKHAEVDVSDLVMGQQEKLVVGIKMIDLFMGSTGLVTTETVSTAMGKKGAKTEVFLVATPETMEWLSVRNAALEMLWPVNLPMIIPPLPWGPKRRGGYRYALRGKHSLVRGITKNHAQTVASSAMPVVYSALNRIQETPWRISPSVYALVQEIVERGGGIAGVPEQNDRPEPARPLDIDTNEVSRREWRTKAHAVKEENHMRKMKALEFSRVLSTASSVAAEPAIWFPCNLDFRGRIYPVVNYLHPQGDDLAKSLLTFAQGKALGEGGVVWLALHGANCLGETPEGLKLSRCTLQERVDWIVDHTRLIEQVAADPFADLWWTKADGPLQFYAFCVEWAAYAKMDRQGMGQQYECALPCAMDGTCNGLQHFSAMLRDEVGAEAVNVSPSDRPQDIYQRIADVVLKRLETETDNEYARKWLESKLVNRKLTKRPTMTFGYGSKKYGFQSQLIKYLQELDNWRDIREKFSKPEGEKVLNQVPAACGYMSGLIWEALAEIVVAASQGMVWMQNAARLITKNKQCVSWKVPGTGFPVRQEYFKYTKRQGVNTLLAGKAFKPCVYEDSVNPDPVKQANAVAPNVVHSLDAAALMMTVDTASASGLDHFGMVHDSYATLAADCPVLAYCTRQAFYALYASQDVVTGLATELMTQVKDFEEFPLPPAKGRLDLGGVLVSDYFFS